LKRLSDCANLIQKHLKDQILNIFDKKPDFKTKFSQLHWYQKFSENWEFNGNIMNAYQRQQNPIPIIVKQMKINRKTGGFFKLSGVRQDKTKFSKLYQKHKFADYAEYHILIETVTDKYQLIKLKDLQQQQTYLTNKSKAEHPSQNEKHNIKVDLKEIESSLNGVGRIIFYRLYDENDHSSKILFSIYEGQI